MKQVKLYNGEEKSIFPTAEAIDPKKIKRELQKRNLSQVEVSEALGYGRNSLSAAINAGVFNGPMIKGLERQFNIKLDDYKLDEPKAEPAPEKPAEPAPVMTDKALYETMRNAMLDAMKEALASSMKDIRGAVYAAVLQARRVE